MSAEVVSLLYHEVTDVPLETGFQSSGAFAYKHSCQQFAENLDQIEGSGGQCALVTALDFSEKKKSFLLTFDDGGKSAMYIADAIESRNMRGHFFVTTNQIGTRYFMSVRDIRELHTRGHVIGSHSHTHPCPFGLLPRDLQVQEYRISCEILEDIIQEPIETSSIPGGDATRQTLANIAHTNLKFCFTSDPTTAPIRMNNTIFLGRLCAKRSTSPEAVRRWTEFRGLSREKATRLAKKLVKKFVYSTQGLSARPVKRYE